MPSHCALASAQTVPIAGDVAANLAQHLELARMAARERAEVVVFPELSLTGYELTRASALAFSPDDARLAPLIALAASASITLIVGAPVRSEAGLLLGAFIIAPDRSCVVHGKSYLAGFAPEVNPGGTVPPDEGTVFVPGKGSPLVQLGDRPGAVALCAESLQPTVFKAAAARGAKSYLTGHFGLFSDREQRLAGLARIAAHCGFAVVFANYAGLTGGLHASGGSAILSPTGTRLAVLPTRGAGVAVASERSGIWRGSTAMLSMT